MGMKRFVIIALVIVTAGCGKPESQRESVEDPAHYRPLVPQDQDGRAVFTAGLSLPVPNGASVTYPQGIDSRLLHIDGQGYTLQLDDYGAFMGPSTTQVGGASAHLEATSLGECKVRVWRVNLPASSPTHSICLNRDGSKCERAPAQASITTFCSTASACQQVDAIIADTRLLPRPWAQVPLPDPKAVPKEPVCRP